jgi:hypothetical protein
MPAGKSGSKTAKAESKDSKPGFNLDELGVFGTILAAIGGGLGILGFVAFFGAAILWLRAEEIGLPGSEAVAIVPKSVLVATGASFLVPALGIAVGFTLLLYLIDAAATWITETSLLSDVSVRNLKQHLLEAQREVRKSKREQEILKGVADTAARTKVQAESAVALEVEPEIVEAQAEDKYREIVKNQASAGLRTIKAEQKLLELEAQLKEAEPGRRDAVEKVSTGILIVVTVLLFAAGTYFVVEHYAVHRSLERGAILGLIALLLVTFCVVVRLRTGSFGWFAVAAFIAVGLMIGTLTYYRTVDRPKAEPVALLRTKGPPVYGFYMAQTSDRVFLGMKPRKGVIRLDSVPREEVVEIVVGDLEPPTAAERRAVAFARRLCLRARERKATGKIAGKDSGGKAGEEVVHGCTAADLRRLEAAADSF